MSSKVVLKNRFRKNKSKKTRQSFDVRICDDLSEVILQYLSLEDKFSLEGVSKQFQSTVFQKVNHFDVQRIILRIERPMLFDYEYPEIPRKRYIQVFKSILKKCTKINSIDLDISCDSGEEIYSSVVRMIAKHCNNLVHITELWPRLKDETITELVAKFNPISFTLNIFANNGYRNVSLLKQLSQIKELHIRCGDPMKWYNKNFLSLSDLSSADLKNLRSVAMESSLEDLDLFETLIDNNQKMRKLQIKLIAKQSDHLDLICGKISRLSHLVELKILSEYMISKQNLKLLAANCRQLKSISLLLNLSKDTELSQFLSPLKEFKELKRLQLSLNHSYNKFSANFIFRSFAGLEKLTHLSLLLRSTQYVPAINYLMLEDIDIYLPKLQYLKSDWPFLPARDAVKTLCRLSRLETIDLNIRDSLLAEEFESVLKNSLKYIRNVSLTHN